jgi:hypothetical protein
MELVSVLDALKTTRYTSHKNPKDHHYLNLHKNLKFCSTKAEEMGFQIMNG